jgi:hypothetical protein
MYPVHYHVDPPQKFTRFQLLLRVAAFFLLGTLGLTFGTVFLLLYLAFPVIAAIRISSRGGEAYVRDDGPFVLRVLGWFAAVSAWSGLITDQFPVRAPEETVHIQIDPHEVHPTPGSALARLVTGIPSVLALAFLGFIGTFVWLWAALTILFTERVGHHAFDFLVGLQRWSTRLLAYEAALVDEYPPFELTEADAPQIPAARAT